MGPEETHPKNTLERAEEHKLLVLRGILLRVGMSAAKISSTIGKEGKTPAMARGGKEDGRASAKEETEALEREEGEAALGEDPRARGSEGAEGRGGPRPLHFGWDAVEVVKVWRHPP